MPIRDPLYHPMFVDRRAALEVALFDSFPPTGRKPWCEPDAPRRDLEFHVRHYKVALDVDFEKKMLHGRATLTIESIGESLHEALLDAAELRISAVRSGRRRIQHSVEGHKLRVTLPRPLGVGRAS